MGLFCPSHEVMPRNTGDGGVGGAEVSKDRRITSLGSPPRFCHGSVILEFPLRWGSSRLTVARSLSNALFHTPYP